jgi:HD-GYP domain-containing protein (c-di-GMP phosphodiesterase class II)
LIIGMYDPYGIGHGERVCGLVVKLASRAGIDPDSQLMKDLSIAADLHDIGKIGVPEAVRRQPGTYLPAERMLMEQHPIIGEKILKTAVNGYITAEVCGFVRHHHENWNGTGYPDELREDQIPLGSRLIRICDFFDALTNVRGYQNALSRAEAIQYMIDQQIQNTWADPELLRLFLEMMRE